MAPFDLYLPTPGVPDPGIPATDLHVSFTVRHVPEPSTLAIAGLFGTAAIGYLRRR